MIRITTNTRPNWTQQAAGELRSLAVCVQLERIAAAEVMRLGRRRHVRITATDQDGVELACVWPAEEPSHWELSGETVARPWETVTRPLAG
ncbi:hypothetical protein SAMN04515692_10525 [Leifsonia sp. CL147]|nr:hypothetical protein SAMN04515694_10526 [Leifsonia sp. CL154]SFL46486.1 hypothetical protein SAMN04515692_10525 [Leifsonia sp. CL147]